MAGETSLTLVGNLTSDPELRFTPSGVAVSNFTIASTPSVLDKSTGEWRDGETIFMDCAVWRDQAENAASSLTKGTRVIVHGRLYARTYEANDGATRRVYEMQVDEVGGSLKHAAARITKNARKESTPALAG